MTIYDFTVKDVNGNEFPLSIYKGKVLLVVNTAIECGFTPQYAGLEKLYRDYRAKGFEVLDFPCNQFGGQAPGADCDIDAFCISRYQTSFPRFTKIEVNGANQSPLYTFLKNETAGQGKDIAWNFTKFLIGKDGGVSARYEPDIKPIDIDPDIQNLLTV